MSGCANGHGKAIRRDNSEQRAYNPTAPLPSSGWVRCAVRRISLHHALPSTSVQRSRPSPTHGNMPLVKTHLPALFSAEAAQVCFGDGHVPPDADALQRSHVAMLAGCVRQLAALSQHATEVFGGKTLTPLSSTLWPLPAQGLALSSANGGIFCSVAASRNAVHCVP